MVAESIVVLTMYWPQSISIGDINYEGDQQTWIVRSNNSVNVVFSEQVEGLEISGYGSRSGKTIMPSDDGTFKVSINKNSEVVMLVTADGQ